ncbi:MAG: hypothetical protein LBB60_11080 [Desulfovibrio sp.]|nr:hypothetical protein [Desulfovibrio sp.]
MKAMRKNSLTCDEQEPCPEEGSSSLEDTRQPATSIMEYIDFVATSRKQFEKKFDYSKVFCFEVSVKNKE